VLTDWSRRDLLALGAGSFTGCSKPDRRYFGRVSRPHSQTLVQVILAEPATLDPHLSADLYESHVIHSLFEGEHNSISPLLLKYASIDLDWKPS
jgi:hypothetical protein